MGTGGAGVGGGGGGEGAGRCGGIATVGPGEFTAPVSIALPQRSVVVFSGTAGNRVQHCIPAVAMWRISITFRRCPPNVRAKLGLK